MAALRRRSHSCGRQAGPRAKPHPMQDHIPHEIEIDARDLRCPLPVLRLQKAIRAAQIGTVVKLCATDAMAQIDVPHFCAEAGHALISSHQENGTYMFFVEKQC